MGSPARRRDTTLTQEIPIAVAVTFFMFSPLAFATCFGTCFGSWPFLVAAKGRETLPNVQQFEAAHRSLWEAGYLPRPGSFRLECPRRRVFQLLGLLTRGATWSMSPASQSSRSLDSSDPCMTSSLVHSTAAHSHPPSLPSPSAKWESRREMSPFPWGLVAKPPYGLSFSHLSPVGGTLTRATGSRTRQRAPPTHPAVP